MLPKSKRIPRELFKAILAERRYFNTQHFTLRVASAPSTKVAVSVSKKVAKSAVDRNRTRRRSYSAIRELLPRLKPGLYLVMAKSGADKLKGVILEQELQQLFRNV